LQNGWPWGVNVQAQPKEAGAGSRLRPILLVFFRHPVNTFPRKPADEPRSLGEPQERNEIDKYENVTNSSLASPQPGHVECLPHCGLVSGLILFIKLKGQESASSAGQHK
jgi:hypothetical protein